MTGQQSLNGNWELAWTDVQSGFMAEYYTSKTVAGKKFMSAAVPGSVHEALTVLGLQQDVNIGLNAMQARWIEEQMWIYRTTFAAPAASLSAAVWLTFARLEFDAVIYLNGEKIALHANANRPLRINISGKLLDGENCLTVRLDSGLFSTADKPIEDYSDQPLERLTKRTFQRKPQYQCGWDWNPRLMNVGILGDVALEWSSVPIVEQLTVIAIPNEDMSSAQIQTRVTIDNAVNEQSSGTLRVQIRETGSEQQLTLQLPAGESRHMLEFSLLNPKLWWPTGHGEQHLYTIDVSFTCDGVEQQLSRRTGVRRVEMNQSVHPKEGRFCILTINNRPIFCKGGNWVPADMLYGSVTPERTRELIDLAAAANFNLLRIWGGGLFIDHVLGDYCDEQGILIWHDFLFACGKFPGDDPDFAAEVRREVTWAVRELAHHPALVVWCGNNEIEWGDWEWGYDSRARTHPHYAIFHHDIPKIVHDEDPSKIHWISSPSSPDFLPANSSIVGDQHPWGVTLGEPGASKWWHYREYIDRFANEGGVLGASSIATLRQFLPEKECYLGSPSWDFHDNIFALYDVGNNGGKPRTMQTVEYWLGADAAEMSLEKYALASGLLQAEGLNEYISNYRRRMFDSACAVFWMYNDSWPTSHGWTIVDYYRRKKLAYHPVRRAFQPVTVVVAEDDGLVTIYGVNDTPHAWDGEVEYGIFTLDGAYPLRAKIAASLPANASTLLASFSSEEWQAVGFTRSAAFAVLTVDGKMQAQYRRFNELFQNLEFAPAQISLQRNGEEVIFNSPVFVWNVCLDVTGEADIADNCFDLLPGYSYSVSWPNNAYEPNIAAVGSRDALK